MNDGRLTRRNDALGAAATLAALADLGQACGGEDDDVSGDAYDVDAVALAVAMAQPFKPMVLSGAATTEQLRSNAGALRLLRRLNLRGSNEGEGADAPDAVAQALARLLEVGRVAPEEYWRERSALVWN